MREQPQKTEEANEKSFRQGLCGEFVEFQGTRVFDLTYLKRKEIAGKKIMRFKPLSSKTHKDI
jgi:hypothetical protein